MRIKKEELIIKRRRKRRVIIKKLKLFFYPLFLFIIFSSLYWCIFYSKFFSINQIKILGEEPNPLNEKEILDLIKNQNQRFTLPYFKDSFSFVFLSEKKLEEELKNNHPEIESLKIKLLIQGNILEVTYKKRQEIFNLKTEKDYFLIDQKGIPFLKIEQPKKDLPIIYIDEDISLGKVAIKEDSLKVLEKCLTLINEKKDLFNFDHFFLEEKDSSDFQVITNKKMKIFINFKDNLDEIFLILEKLKTQKFQNSFDNIEYIDLRYLPKVYYK